jgi:hypothetical protein
MTCAPRIAGNPLLADIGPTGLSATQSVANEFVVDSTAPLGPTGISSLVSVGTFFQVTNNTQLCNSIPLAGRAHTTVGGTTTITGNNTGC